MFTWIRRAAAIAAAALVSIPVAAVAGPVAPASAAAASLDSYDRDMFRIVNEERARAGVAPLQWYEPARPAALDHSAFLQRIGDFYHDPNFRQEMESVGCTYTGENIFFERKYDYRAGIRTPDAAYSMMRYMDSPGHRANILRPDYRFFVAGTSYDPVAGSLYNTQRFAGHCPADARTALPPGGTTEFQLLGSPTSTASPIDLRLDVPASVVAAGDWDGNGI